MADFAAVGQRLVGLRTFHMAGTGQPRIITRVAEAVLYSKHG